MSESRVRSFATMGDDVKTYGFSALRAAGKAKTSFINISPNSRETPLYQLTEKGGIQLRVPYDIHKPFQSKDGKESKEDKEENKFIKNCEVCIDNPELKVQLELFCNNMIDRGVEHAATWWGKKYSREVIETMYTSPLGDDAKKANALQKGYTPTVRIKVDLNPNSPNRTHFYRIEEVEGSDGVEERLIEVDSTELKPNCTCAPVIRPSNWFTANGKWGTKFTCIDMLIFPPKERPPCQIQWGNAKVVRLEEKVAQSEGEENANNTEDVGFPLEPTKEEEKPE